MARRQFHGRSFTDGKFVATEFFCLVALLFFLSIILPSLDFFYVFSVDAKEREYGGHHLFSFDNSTQFLLPSLDGVRETRDFRLLRGYRVFLPSFSCLGRSLRFPSSILFDD